MKKQSAHPIHLMLFLLCIITGVVNSFSVIHPSPEVASQVEDDDDDDDLTYLEQLEALYELIQLKAMILKQRSRLHLKNHRSRYRLALGLLAGALATGAVVRHRVKKRNKK